MNEPTSDSSAPEKSQPLVRLQRVMAAAGIASRRQCEQIILEGRVTVDGNTVTALGTKVDPQTQKITVDGQGIRRRRHVYFMLNKPPGVLSTNHDDSGRLRVIDLVDSNERVYTVGRLDKSSEGLILVTNDGQWANELTHPRYGVEKTYLVRVVGCPSPENISKLRSGIRLAEGMAKASDVRTKKAFQNCTDLEIVLKEGRNREIRRVMAHLGHKVVMLKRIAIGSVRLGELPRGAFRELTTPELDSLRRSVVSQSAKSSGKRPARHGGSRAKHGRYAAKSFGRLTRQGTPARRPRAEKIETTRPSRKGFGRPSAARDSSRSRGKTQLRSGGKKFGIGRPRKSRTGGRS